MLSSLIGSASFLSLASMTSMPVSATHAAVGGVIGMTLMGAGPHCLSWNFTGLSGIIASWFISPLLSGFVAVVLYWSTTRFIVEAARPLARILNIGMPMMTASTVFLVVSLICLKSPVIKTNLSSNLKWVPGTVLAALSWFASYFIVRTKIQNLLPSKCNPAYLQHELVGMNSQQDHKFGHPDSPAGHSSNLSAIPTTTTEQEDVSAVFKYMLVFIAALESFAHGANDTGRDPTYSCSSSMLL